MSTIREKLDELFDAERRLRALHSDLLKYPRPALVRELGQVVAAARESREEEEATLRLSRTALVLGELEGDDVVDLLVDILDAELPEPRLAAGEALEALAFDRFKEVALGIERALERLPKGSPALTELPFLLAEVGEPGCVKLLGRFLKHTDPDAVAAAIEAIAELGDPAAIPLLAPLEGDGRQVQLDEEEGEGERVAIGDLAYEARELLLEVQEGAGDGEGDRGRDRKEAPKKKGR